MPITTDYDTFATRYHGSAVEISHSEDTPDEFFDALDEFFGTDDGYTHHLSRIYAMKDKIASLQASEAKLEAENELNLKYNDGDLVYSEEDLTELKEGWGEVLQDEIDELKEELDRTAYIAAAPEMRYTGEEMEKMVNVMEHIDEHPDYKETIDDLLSDYEDDIKKLKAENTLLTGQLISSKAVIEELS